MKGIYTKIALSLAVISSFASCTSIGVRFYEQADYDLLHKEEVMEVRQYPKLLVAETSVNLSYDESYAVAFQRLAKYIAGNNVLDPSALRPITMNLKRPGQNISMKVPFIMNKTAHGWTMHFVMPPEYTKRSIPIPVDKHIRIKEIPARKVAAIHYTGEPELSTVKKQSKVLKEWLEARRYATLSEPRLAMYDTNEVLPMFRRNEVHIDVD